MRFDQVGEFASSKSAMNMRAPELSALITIFRSVGPVISTRLSRRSAGTGEMAHSLSRISAVSGKKSGSSPAARRSRRSARAASRSRRRASNRPWISVTKSSASGVRMRSVAASAAVSTVI